MPLERWWKRTQCGDRWLCTADSDSTWSHWLCRSYCNLSNQSEEGWYRICFDAGIFKSVKTEDCRSTRYFSLMPHSTLNMFN